MAKSMFDRESSRRDFMRRGLCGIGVSAALPIFLRQSSTALAMQALGVGNEKYPNRIMVVLELSGGNDGLNAVVPFAHDEYYKARPLIAVPARVVRKLNDEIGFNPQLQGLHQLFQDGHVAVINGCGYPDPILSHFQAMDWWHSGVPHGAEELGWVGRTADAIRRAPQENFIMNITTAMAPAVRASVHSPVVFGDPEKFRRVGGDAAMASGKLDTRMPDSSNPTLGFLQGISSNAATASVLVRDAVASYQTPVDYGTAGATDGTNLKTVAALIKAGLPTRFYYVNYGGFDTHSNQPDTHARLSMYTADAIRGFMDDMERIGRAGDVAMMIFSEFGRRVSQNSSNGTDHGTAGPMFIVGKTVKGGVYGRHPSLADLDENGNLKFTTDFRRVYATMIKEWMGYDDTRSLLRGDFATLGAFA